MDAWRVHKLINKSEGQEVQIGGALLQMKIGGVNGPLDSITVEPVEQDEDPELQTHAAVKLKVADRVVWMDLLEVEEFVKLMQLAHDAALNS